MMKIYNRLNPLSEPSTPIKPPPSFGFLILIILAITLITGILLLIFSASLYSVSDCNFTNETNHLWEIFSNLYYIVDVIYVWYMLSWFHVLHFLGIFLMSSLYHLCDSIDQLNCTMACSYDLNILSYGDLVMGSLIIYSLGFYRLTKNYKLLQKLILILIPFILGSIYMSNASPNTTLAGFDTTDTIIYTLLFILAAIVLLLRWQLNEYSLVLGHSFASVSYFILTIIFTIIAFGIHFSQSTLGYQWSHAWWHCTSAASILLYMLYIDTRILEDGTTSN